MEIPGKWCWPLPWGSAVMGLLGYVLLVPMRFLWRMVAGGVLGALVLMVLNFFCSPVTGPSHRRESLHRADGGRFGTAGSAAGRGAFLLSAIKHPTHRALIQILRQQGQIGILPKMLLVGREPQKFLPIQPTRPAPLLPAAGAADGDFRSRKSDIHPHARPGSYRTAGSRTVPRPV